MALPRSSEQRQSFLNSPGLDGSHFAIPGHREGIVRRQYGHAEHIDFQSALAWRKNPAGRKANALTGKRTAGCARAEPLIESALSASEERSFVPCRYRACASQVPGRDIRPDLLWPQGHRVPRSLHTLVLLTIFVLVKNVDTTKNEWFQGVPSNFAHADCPVERMYS